MENADGKSKQQEAKERKILTHNDGWTLSQNCKIWLANGLVRFLACFLIGGKPVNFNNK